MQRYLGVTAARRPRSSANEPPSGADGDRAGRRASSVRTAMLLARRVINGLAARRYVRSRTRSRVRCRQPRHATPTSRVDQAVAAGRRLRGPARAASASRAARLRGSPMHSTPSAWRSSATAGWSSSAACASAPRTTASAATSCRSATCCCSATTCSSGLKTHDRGRRRLRPVPAGAAGGRLRRDAGRPWPAASSATPASCATSASSTPTTSTRACCSWRDGRQAAGRVPDRPSAAPTCACSAGRSPRDGSVTYIDTRGERDIALPPRHSISSGRATTRDMDGQRALSAPQHPRHAVRRDDGRRPHDQGREQHRDGPGHLQRAGRGPDPVARRRRRSPTRRSASLILLKVLPYRETPVALPRLQHAAPARWCASTPSCRPASQLPEDHGIIFPGGYYLQTGEHKAFDAGMSTACSSSACIRSPNGEDVLYVFYEPTPASPRCSSTT